MPLTPFSHTTIPPSVAVPMRETTPRSTATSGVPATAKMSVPSCQCSYTVPVMRGAPKESPNEWGSATGKPKPWITTVPPAEVTATSYAVVVTMSSAWVSVARAWSSRLRASARSSAASTWASAAVSRACAVVVDGLLLGVEQPADEGLAAGEIDGLGRSRASPGACVRRCRP